MPLINCPDCEQPVSGAAPVCIHCGRPGSNATPADVGGSAGNEHAEVEVLKGGEGMRALGALGIVLGLGLLVYAAVMDTSVATPPLGLYGMPDRVHNVGLMSQQQNYLLIGGVLLISGILLLGLGYSLRKPLVRRANESSPHTRKPAGGTSGTEEKPRWPAGPFDVVVVVILGMVAWLTIRTILTGL